MNTRPQVRTEHFVCVRACRIMVLGKSGHLQVSVSWFLHPSSSRSFSLTAPSLPAFSPGLLSQLPFSFSTVFCLSGWISCEEVQDTNNIHVSPRLRYLCSYCTTLPTVPLPHSPLYLSIHWCSICPLKPSALSHFSHCLRSFLTPLAR